MVGLLITLNIDEIWRISDTKYPQALTFGYLECKLGGIYPSTNSIVRLWLKESIGNDSCNGSWIC